MDYNTALNNGCLGQWIVPQTLLLPQQEMPVRLDLVQRFDALVDESDSLGFTVGSAEGYRELAYRVSQGNAFALDHLVSRLLALYRHPASSWLGKFIVVQAWGIVRARNLTARRGEELDAIVAEAAQADAGEIPPLVNLAKWLMEPGSKSPHDIRLENPGLLVQDGALDLLTDGEDPQWLIDRGELVAVFNHLRQLWDAPDIVVRRDEAIEHVRKATTFLRDIPTQSAWEGGCRGMRRGEPPRCPAVAQSHPPHGSGLLF